MNKRLVIFFLLSILFSGICYLVTADLICSGIVVLIFIIFFIFADKKLQKFINETKRYHECYHFINSFLISLSVKGSLIEAIDSSRMSMGESFNNVLERVTNMNENEKLNYLNNYFNFRIYDVFLNIVNMWEEGGGDIIAYSYFLINEAKNNEEYLLACERINRRKLVEFSSLWLLSLVILVILRFSLNQFYSKISSLLLYKIAIVGFFIIILLSIYILVNKITELKLKGNTLNVVKK